jgi:UDP-2,4-diacetamido-2,4,6-trideoxy-beta-L-altropyranose hydrolase
VKVAFRVDAAPEMGTGHVMRCLALADGLRRRGAAIRFLSRRLTGTMEDLIAQRGFELACLDGRTGPRDTHDHDLAHAGWLDTTQAADAAASADALGANWDWLVVDHYALDARWERAMRGRASRILAIDDLANRQHDCDALLDQNPYSTPERRYDNRAPSTCRFLLGPRYALLRQEFAARRAQVSPRRGAVRRLLVSFGGSDPHNHTAVAIEALQAMHLDGGAVDVVVGAAHVQREAIETACQRAGFRCHVQTDRMADLVAEADLGVGAAGVSSWERCCLGLPTLTLPAGSDQRDVIEDAARQGLLYAPDGDAPVTPASIALHVRALLDNPGLREMLSRNGMAAVDGGGVDRVVRIMDDRMTVRAATAADAGDLFVWRNHESVRSAARNSGPIARPDHDAWLAAVLADPDRMLLIGERDGKPVGVVRFDVTGDHAEVSTYLVPGVAEPGLGSMLQLATERWLAGQCPDVTTIVAEVLADNEASHGFLRATGYRRRSTVYEKRIRPRE